MLKLSKPYQFPQQKNDWIKGRRTRLGFKELEVRDELLIINICDNIELKNGN